MNFFDLHADTPFSCYKQKITPKNQDLAASFNYADCFENWHQVYAVWIDDKANNPYKLYKDIIGDFKKSLKKKPKNLEVTLSVEGGRVIERDINRVKEMYADGVRIFTLTWNGENAIAGGCNSTATLTKFGRNVIKEMNRFNMVCDVSHLNSKSFFKTIDIAERVIATHSNCSAVYNCKRNLTDEQIGLIAQKNGLIGICFFPAFLGGDTFEKIYQNIYHLLEMGLEENIAIGSDFDGADMDSRLKNTGDILELYFRLSEKGIPDKILDKIFYINAKKYIANL